MLRLPRLKGPPLLRSTAYWFFIVLLSVGPFAQAEENAAGTVAKPTDKADKEVTKPTDKQADKQEATEDPAIKDVAAGHSYHGEAFNQGPRQAAYLMGGTGNVSFPATCKNETVQQFINQGVGQLHGFWYFESERSFRQAASLDPDCAIAYWGMAMSNGGNSKRAKGFIAEAMKRLDSVTERERMYINAVNTYVNTPTKPTAKDKERRQNYIKALEGIIDKYPDDIEAKAFWAVARWSSKSRVPIKSDKDYKAVNDMIQLVLDKNPMHPAHHYRIHLWDYKDAKKALASSALCGQSAPAIAHMWHMPGHIFSRLNRFNDAAWQQEASARVDHAHMMRDRVLPDQIHNFAHNNEWLCRNLMNVGRVNDAIDLAMNMTELPRHPKYNTLTKRRGSASYGRTRLYEALSKYDLWDRMIALMDQGYLEKTGDHRQDLQRMRMLGIAAYEANQPKRAESIINDLQSRLAKLQAEQDAAGVKAYDEALKKAQAEQAKQEKLRQEQEKKKQEAKKQEELKQNESKKEESKKEEKNAAPNPADQANKAEPKPKADSDKKPAPKPKKKPAKKQTPEQLANKAKTDARKKFDSRVNEIAHALADIMAYQALARGDNAEASKQIFKAGSVPNYRKARVMARIGNWKKAEEFARKEADSRKHRVQPLADLVYVLYHAGKKDEAKTKFEELRKLSMHIEMASPVFTRINDIAKEFGIEGDWRIEEKLADDIGERPDLDELGPFRWQPTPAPDWKLRTADNKSVSLSDYRGKNVIVIFYLGADCLHCIEQLAAFAPETKKFKEAGIEIVGVSTDDMLNLKRSLESVKEEGGYAFPLVSNAGLSVFKKYRCYDDFEKLTLHGTFLIDKDGLVRWQDISYEPFTEVKFLLGEAQRLLKQKAKRAVAAK